jgi:hypothetical protein
MNELAIGEEELADENRDFSINGEVIDGVRVFVHKEEVTSELRSESFSAHFKKQSIAAIRPISLTELLDHFDYFRIDLPHTPVEPGDWFFGTMRAGSEVDEETSQRLILIDVDFELEYWDRPYSLTDLAGFLELEFEPPLKYEQEDPDSLMFGFGARTTYPDELTVGEILDHLLPKLQMVSDYARESLESLVEQSLTTEFEFPEEVRPACEQYLLYFGQFLKDLGIVADTQIREQASRVLFTVTPRDREQALDAIREALSCYLQMPHSPEIEEVMGRSGEIAIVQLHANLMHLRSQVLLANAIVQAKDATISAKEREIETLRNGLDLRNFTPSLPERTTHDSEEIIEGILSVKKMEYKGLELNTPEILRRLKRFRK